MDAMEGTEELRKIQESSLGVLFNLPIRKCSFSGKLVHQLLCRSLQTSNENEIWFVFGGKLVRFSLREFAMLTALPCGPFPDHPTTTGYWKTFFGEDKSTVLIDETVTWLKSDKLKKKGKKMPRWKKMKLVLVVIVDGILLCERQPVGATSLVVEMLRKVYTFLAYPWGRLSFQINLRMLRVGSKVKDVDNLVGKFSQFHITNHGFPVAIQLLAFRAISMLLKYLPHAEDLSTFDDRTQFRLPIIKTFSNKKILQTEQHPSVTVESVLHTDEPIDEEQFVWPNDQMDPTVDKMLAGLQWLQIHTRNVGMTVISYL